jgi:hypothetical protein
VIQTCQQINKDLLGLIDDPVTFDIDMDEHVLSQMIQIVSEIIKRIAKQNLAQFIYKVDLKEANFIELIDREKGLSELAFMVVRREAQKIYLRRHFS